MNHNHVKDTRFLFLMASMADMSNQESTELKEKIYATALADVAIDDLERAVWHLINTRKTASFPKVGEIREALAGGNTAELSTLALGKLEKGMSLIGRYRSAVFDDPLIHAAVSLMGGWVKLCSMEPEEWKWGRKEFEKVYQSMLSKPLESLTIPHRLPGVEETHNSAHGYRKKLQIAYQGDEQKILAWQARLKDATPQIENLDVRAAREKVGKLLAMVAGGES